MKRPSREPVVILKEGRRDHEAALAKKKLTDQQIKDHVPQIWKDRAEAGKRQIAIPIPGTDHYS